VKNTYINSEKSFLHYLCASTFCMCLVGVWPLSDAIFFSTWQLPQVPYHSSSLVVLFAVCQSAKQ